MMKRFFIGLLKWLGRVLALLCAIVLVPYATRYAEVLFPDPAAAITQSVTLSQKLSASARLETNVIDKEGVLDSKVDAAFVGTVQEVKILYNYHASLGIDLSRVQINVNGKTITLTLPPLEILSDSLTPTETYVDDFWYKLTETRRQSLLNDETIACRKNVLQEWANSDEAKQNTINAVSSTIGEWISLAGIQLNIVWGDA